MSDMEKEGYLPDPDDRDEEDVRSNYNYTSGNYEKQPWEHIYD
jgi:hypothetical protein